MFGTYAVDSGSIVEEVHGGVEVRMLVSAVHTEIDVNLKGAKDKKVLDSILQAKAGDMVLDAATAGGGADGGKEGGAKKKGVGFLDKFNKQPAALTQKTDYGMRVFVLYNAHTLSGDAQSSLRRTMETVAGRHKIFLVAQDSQTLMAPIQNGRCIKIPIQSPDPDILKQMLLETMKRERLDCAVDMKYEPTQLEELADAITKEANGDVKKAFWLLHSSFAKKDPEAKQVQLVNVTWLDGVRKIVEMVSPKRVGDDRPVLDGVRFGTAGLGGVSGKPVNVGDARASIGGMGGVGEKFLQPFGGNTSSFGNKTSSPTPGSFKLNHTAVNEQQIEVTCDFNSNENLGNRDKEFPFETIIHEVNKLLIAVPPTDLILAIRDALLKKEFWLMRPSYQVDLLRESCITAKRLNSVLGNSSCAELHVLAFLSHAIDQVFHAKRLVDDRHMRTSLLAFYKARREEERDPTLAKRRKEKHEVKQKWKLV